MRAAHARGAQVILLQELFATPYFCIEQDARHLQLAQSADDSPLLRRFGALARRARRWCCRSASSSAPATCISIPWPCSMPTGSRLGIYRKSHIPDGPGYQEKFYFSPGDTGFRVWDTRYGRLGVGHLLGPVVSGERAHHGAAGGGTAAVSDRHRQRAAAGAAGGFAAALAAHAAGACGRQPDAAGGQQPHRHRARAATIRRLQIRFYGSSFIADASGALLAEAAQDEETVITASFDLEALKAARDNWFVFRDRRPDLYGPLGSLSLAPTAVLRSSESQSICSAN